MSRLKNELDDDNDVDDDYDNDDDNGGGCPLCTRWENVPSKKCTW